MDYSNDFKVCVYLPSDVKDELVSKRYVYISKKNMIDLNIIEGSYVELVSFTSNKRNVGIIKLIEDSIKQYYKTLEYNSYNYMFEDIIINEEIGDKYILISPLMIDLLENTYSLTIKKLDVIDSIKFFSNNELSNNPISENNLYFFNVVEVTLIVNDDIYTKNNINHIKSIFKESFLSNKLISVGQCIDLSEIDYSFICNKDKSSIIDSDYISYNNDSFKFCFVKSVKIAYLNNLNEVETFYLDVNNINHVNNKLFLNIKREENKIYNDKNNISILNCFTLINNEMLENNKIVNNINFKVNIEKNKSISNTSNNFVKLYSQYQKSYVNLQELYKTKVYKDRLDFFYKSVTFTCNKFCLYSIITDDKYLIKQLSYIIAIKEYYFIKFIDLNDNIFFISDLIKIMLKIKNNNINKKILIVILNCDEFINIYNNINNYNKVSINYKNNEILFEELIYIINSDNIKVILNYNSQPNSNCKLYLTSTYNIVLKPLNLEEKVDIIGNEIVKHICNIFLNDKIMNKNNSKLIYNCTYNYIINNKDIKNKLSKYTVGMKINDLKHLIIKSNIILKSEYLKLINQIFKSVNDNEYTKSFEEHLTKILSFDNIQKASNEISKSMIKLNLTSISSIPSISWKEVGGHEDAKEIINETIHLPLRFPKLFKSKIILFINCSCF